MSTAIAALADVHACELAAEARGSLRISEGVRCVDTERGTRAPRAELPDKPRVRAEAVHGVL